MKKVFLVTQKKDAPGTLKALRKLGIMHIVHVNSPAGETISILNDDIRNLKKAIDILGVDENDIGELNHTQCREAAKEVLHSRAQISLLEEQINKRQTVINEWEQWGNFDPDDIKNLPAKGINASLLKIPVKELSNIPDNVFVLEVYRVSGVAHCVVLSKKEINLPFEAVDLPTVSLDKMKSHQDKDEKEIGKAKELIHHYRLYKNSFKKLYDKLTSDLRLQEASAGMGQAENIVYLKGFCPEDSVENLIQTSKKEKWALSIEAPSPEDNVPTLLRNPKWVEIIKPVFSVMNILPGYKEVDISAFFLLFFSVFFGMLIGDAGYGLVFLLMTFFAHVKLNKKVKDKSAFFLMYVLSFCTIAWGVLTGTFFGQEWLQQSVRPLLPWLRDNDNVQMLCFLIGTFHLSIAHIWRFILKLPSIAAVSELGWLSLLWSMFYIAKTLILGSLFPSFALFLLGVGLLLVIFFSRPNKNIFKAVGSGLGELLLSITSAFTDIVSYIRLFAVGLATVAVADAFNSMAAGIGFGSITASAITALILIAGHSLNILLGAMAILVHGVRLNVLEFSSHLNMEWTGINYNPFRGTKEENL